MQDLWESALSWAAMIQELLALSEEVSDYLWSNLVDDLSALQEEEIPLLETRVIDALARQTRMLLQAKRIHQTLTEADWVRWDGNVNLVLALNNYLPARAALYRLRRDAPEQLTQLLSVISISEQEIPTVVFDKPEEIKETGPMTEADRQAFIARIYDDPNNYR